VGKGGGDEPFANAVTTRGLMSKDRSLVVSSCCITAWWKNLDSILPLNTSINTLAALDRQGRTWEVGCRLSL
jgi:hypothetical protein